MFTELEKQLESLKEMLAEYNNDTRITTEKTAELALQTHELVKTLQITTNNLGIVRGIIPQDLDVGLKERLFELNDEIKNIKRDVLIAMSSNIDV